MTVEGSGQTVSEKFELAEGTYRVHATVEVSGFDGFAAYIHEPGGGEDLLFNEIIESGGTWEGAAVYEARRSGMYYVEATNTSSDWTMAFEPY